MTNNVHELNPRLRPAEGLNEAERELWKQVVDSRPPAYFTADSAPLLFAYVKATTNQALVVEALEKLPPDIMSTDAGLHRYDTLTRLLDRQSRLLATLATKMRLTQQSRYTPHAANTTENAPTLLKKPWEMGLSNR